MSSRKTLLEISYHDDDDTGMYRVGEIDFGVYGTFDEYIKHYGRNGLNEILLSLCHLIWHTKEYGGRIIKEQQLYDEKPKEQK
jgi:hypothetical protein